MINQNKYSIAIEAGKHLSEVFSSIITKIRIGISAVELDNQIHEFITEKGDIPAFLNYKGYPKSSCISFNDEVVHGIPSNQVLKDGDIISVDIGLKHNGIIVDGAFTVGVGKIKGIEQKMILTCQKALDIAAKEIKIGKKTGDLGYAIEKFVNKAGFNVIKSYCGHGTGEKLHLPPSLPNFGNINTGDEFLAGQMLAVEPMIVDGDFEVFVDKNNWTVKTLKGAKSAHFETTFLLSDEGLLDLIPIIRKPNILANQK